MTIPNVGVFATSRTASPSSYELGLSMSPPPDCILLSVMISHRHTRRRYSRTSARLSAIVPTTILQYVITHLLDGWVNGCLGRAMPGRRSWFHGFCGQTPLKLAPRRATAGPDACVPQSLEPHTNSTPARMYLYPRMISFPLIHFPNGMFCKGRFAYTED